MKDLFAFRYCEIHRHELSCLDDCHPSVVFLKMISRMFTMVPGLVPTTMSKHAK